MINNLFASLGYLYPRSMKVLTGPLTRLIKGRLWLQVLVGMVLGVAVGIALNPDSGLVVRTSALAIGEWIALPGHLFLAFIQMIVVPLILASIIRGITAATDVQQLKSTGIWLGVYFLGAAVLAVTIGISVGLVLKPGNYVDMAEVTQSMAPPEGASELVAETPSGSAEGQEGFGIQDIPGEIVELLPTNPMGAIAEGDMLQIVIFAIVLGLGLLSLEPRSAKPLVDLFGSMQSVSMSVVGVAMTFAPVAVFGLLAQTMIKTGPQVLAGLGVYAGAVIFGMALLLAAYLVLVAFLGARNPFRFFGQIREAFLLAFSTNSSAATMPVTVRSAEENLKVRPSLAQLVVPLGATVNMGGTALYQGLATIFMAQMFQMDLPVSALVALVVTALGASIGTPAVPGVGIVVLATVLTSAGVPLTGLAMIIGLDQVLERFRTSLNVTGDLVACVILDRFLPAKISREAEQEHEQLLEQNRQAEPVDTVIE
ncbi:dicarboxylate/amino acid:cation symporter [Thiohalophilus sp.]|uniref:dicarboxylate/amino acid:cation symporter n=1 Tax=Thiohalophilus sp. TaxID=3028392 RepID=UPI002ACEB335|nr:dicarboxylate/amino acid:cation symporter [Thiohalophilus sp.]MDZ7803126.1 dicarboxylate/amino acid:cation symporter [Thiohalophilus sp.]